MNNLSILDAEEASAVIKDALAGKTQSSNRIRTSSVSYRPLAGATLSKNILLLKKKRTLFTIEEGICLISTFVLILILKDIVSISLLLIFMLFSVIRESGLEEELKNIYIYLIPDTSANKLLYILILPFLKSILFVCLPFLFLWFVLPVTFGLWICCLIDVISFIPILLVGNLLSIRFLKSRDNLLVKSTIRSVVVILPGIPIVLLLVGLFLFAPAYITNMLLIVGSS